MGYIKIDQENFKKCKERTKQQLINYLKIDEKYHEHKLEYLEEDEKQIAIWKILAKNIVDKYELEILNALELFYFAKNIPLKRKNNIYLVKYKANIYQFLIP